MNIPDPEPATPRRIDTPSLWFIISGVLSLILASAIGALSWGIFSQTISPIAHELSAGLGIVAALLIVANLLTFIITYQRLRNLGQDRLNLQATLEQLRQTHTEALSREHRLNEVARAISSTIELSTTLATITRLAAEL